MDLAGDIIQSLASYLGIEVRTERRGGEEGRGGEGREGRGGEGREGRGGEGRGGEQEGRDI